MINIMDALRMLLGKILNFILNHYLPNYCYTYQVCVNNINCNVALGIGTKIHFCQPSQKKIA